MTIFVHRELVKIYTKLSAMDRNRVFRCQANQVKINFSTFKQRLKRNEYDLFLLCLNRIRPIRYFHSKFAIEMILENLAPSMIQQRWARFVQQKRQIFQNCRLAICPTDECNIECIRMTFVCCVFLGIMPINCILIGNSKQTTIMHCMYHQPFALQYFC